MCQIFYVFPIWIKSTLSTWDATQRIGISMLSTWTMHNRHIIGAILAHPDFSKKFVLDTDARNEAIGAVLSQEIDGKERPIAFASRTLTKPERRYCVT
jgi:hypothetical protein